MAKKNTELTIQYPESLDIIDPSQKKAIIEKTPEEYVRERVGRGNRKVKYVETGYVIKKLNEIFNYMWEFEVLEEKVYSEAGQVIIKGKLTVHPSPDFQIVKIQYGGSNIKVGNGKPISLADDFKAAASDCLKKCASLLGIASDVYWGKEVEDVEDGVENASTGIVGSQEATQKPALASETKKKMYFAVARAAGFEGDKAKDIAKKMFKLESFNDITADQINKIVDQMTKRVKETEQKQEENEIPDINEILDGQVDDLE